MLIGWGLALVVAGAVRAAEDAGTPSTPPDQLLLKDYRPRSIFNVPQTRVERARFPVVDVHSHAYAKTPADVERWVRTLDAVGIERSIILTGATGKRFDDLSALYGRYPDRFELWCGIDYAGFDQPGFGPAAIAELERCVRAGARGVGELSDKGAACGATPGGCTSMTRAWAPSSIDAPSSDCRSTSTWARTAGCTNRWTPRTTGS
ncbi:MAG: hypothetical protein M5U12_08140 [Verrucomicrobia bacterium]|nr:hypothetical protein [Verrucomicrobiota bacterium]